MKYEKYHALGNDYLVMHPSELEDELSTERISMVCHRHYGVGSDGILLGPTGSLSCDFGLRIFNPDGSEAEKSGNGIRIFSRFLWDKRLVGYKPFTVETLGGPVTCQVSSEGKSVMVNMGKVSFDSTQIPVAGPQREVLKEQMEVGGRLWNYCAATVGNPHCVIPCDNPLPETAKHYGPLMEVNPRFPNRTNVQFMKVIDRKNIRIEIWERGAGYTLASGSSSTAAAAVAFKLGLCGSHINVHMPGGLIRIDLTDDYEATMTGPVTRVCEGIIDKEMFDVR